VDGASDQVLAALEVERGLDALADAGALQLGKDGGDLHERASHSGAGVLVDVEEHDAITEGFKKRDGLRHVHHQTS